MCDTKHLPLYDSKIAGVLKLYKVRQSVTNRNNTPMDTVTVTAVIRMVVRVYISRYTCTSGCLLLKISEDRGYNKTISHYNDNLMT